MADFIRDSFLTLAAPETAEIKIKGSRFIAQGFPLSGEPEADEILNRIRKKDHTATHHCFAWVVGLDDNKFKYSDDGEPSGTAGRPIYNVITGRELINLLVVVTRYYGGTKLGTGGLTRAYSQATSEMLEKAQIIERLICDRISFDVPFTYYDRLMRIISEEKYLINAQDFGEIVSFDLSIRKSKTDKFKSRLVELTGGKIEITHKG